LKLPLKRRKEKKKITAITTAITKVTIIKQNKAK